LIEDAVRTERAARRAERCADEWLVIARRLIRDVDEGLARRAAAAQGRRPDVPSRQ
jgi:hypothetical protein